MLLLSSFVLSSQNIDFMTGMNKSEFYNDSRSSNQGGWGCFLRMGIDGIKMQRLPLRFTIGFENYGGEASGWDGGLGGGGMVYVNFRKTIITLGAYPINFRIIDRIDLNFGFEHSRLLTESYSGEIYSSGYKHPLTFICYLEDRYDHYSEKTTSGLRGRIAYDHVLSDKWAVSAEYSYYLGLSPELDEFPESLRSRRHQAGIGLQYRIQK